MDTYFQVAVRLKSLVALIATKSPYICVQLKVLSEVGVLSESFATDMADKVSLPSVNEQMVNEGVPLVKQLAAKFMRAFQQAQLLLHARQLEFNH